ncbi:uncharacterized protein BDZ99DRAFT_524583 [Mytilinidion resinicola]|uniref:DRBM domain-containing protein n=1 Tax=Mytilinidion resinicola TaxID=574789 RepID=A0A6A6YA92_9PEZI|nr:uncharacterized protein BDZ99DRAFT_524583 [Mytilinidion resinicola]KAF2805620.1 hypothetical protein BDZ99DRAFT_524583 [Mytilinidion resinicola]
MAARPTFWQDRLKDHCNAAQIEQPRWQDVSDRRGGRTAWSSVVVVGEKQFPARYWYDGNYVEQAREDAAECALQFYGQTPATTTYQRAYGQVSSS